jgi:hypothetical protein
MAPGAGGASALGGPTEAVGCMRGRESAAPGSAIPQARDLSHCARNHSCFFIIPPGQLTASFLHSSPCISARDRVDNSRYTAGSISSAINRTLASELAAKGCRQKALFCSSWHMKAIVPIALVGLFGGGRLGRSEELEPGVLRNSSLGHKPQAGLFQLSELPQLLMGWFPMSARPDGERAQVFRA